MPTRLEENAMTHLMKSAGLAVATAGLAIATPASAAEIAPVDSTASTFLQFAETPSFGDLTYEHKRKRHHRHYRDYDYDDDDYGYDEPVYRNTRVWRGRDGRYYCKRKDGTTGLLIGGAAGALIGREIARDRTLGAILGAAGGAILGRSIDRGNRRCR